MREMTPHEIHEFVAHNQAGVLGLADGGRAYALPVLYGYDGRFFYFHTHHGLKSRFIPATSEACLTIVRAVALDDWASVMAFGPVDRVDGTPAHLAAMNALMNVPLPPEWGESPQGEPRREHAPTETYRLTPSRMTGRYSMPPPPPLPEAVK